MNPHCFFFLFLMLTVMEKIDNPLPCARILLPQICCFYFCFSLIFYAALSRVPVKYNATVHPASLFVRIKQRTHNMLISER